MKQVELVKATEKDVDELHRMQVEAFMPLYEIYHDEGSPAIEPVERIRRRAALPNRTYYFICVAGARVGAINIGRKDSEEATMYISPIFILPRYQNRGYGYAAIQRAFAMHPEVKTWKLDTIKQEKRNCHLYEKCGFVRTGEEEVVYGDSGYLGAEKRDDSVKTNRNGQKINYKINKRPSPSQNRSVRSQAQIRRHEHEKSSVRSKVEHVFAVVKGQLGFRKTRYKGRRKQEAKLNMMFALANIILAGRRGYAAV